MTDYILDEKGEEVISERHQKHFKKEETEELEEQETVSSSSAAAFTNISFDDI